LHATDGGRQRLSVDVGFEIEVPQALGPKLHGQHLLPQA